MSAKVVAAIVGTVAVVGGSIAWAVWREMNVRPVQVWSPYTGEAKDSFVKWHSTPEQSAQFGPREPAGYMEAEDLFFFQDTDGSLGAQQFPDGSWYRFYRPNWKVAYI